jgi:acyl transferase domain-containing protein/surfactin synthase thioesterase subunit
MSQKTTQEPIAITGIGCRFPGNIQSPASFWEFLSKGGDAITDIPSDRWNIQSFYDPNPNKAGKIKAKKGGFLNGIDQFDAGFFNIFPNEAQRIDPQQRLLLEVSYEAMEDSGITLDNISGSRTGVYMGVFMNDYWDIQASTAQREHISPHVPMGVSLTAIANRLSYVFNLKGPSMTVDTACSSSLVCVHLACQSIWSGESDQALAGGVNLILRPESSIMMSKGNFLSPDGYCKSFDSRANGYVRSEGSGVIVLKPLSKALENGDQIYAVIRGSAVNQDGHTEEGFTVPSVEAQTEMLKTAYTNAGVDPKEVVYVEAHGTGTPVGDPIETKAFSQVLGAERKETEPCVIGSVKSNIGHLEAAAGIAGLIKLSLILKNRQIPANLHFLKPNPKIPFEQYRLRVPTALEKIEKKGTLYGGVNSFGAGGTNAHIVLQSYDEQPATSSTQTVKTGAHIFFLSGKTKEALRENVQSYLQYLAHTDANLAAICQTNLTRKTSFEHKLVIAAHSKEEIISNLEAFLIDETRPFMLYTQNEHKYTPKIGFIYSGQGPQWYAMGQQLLVVSPVFRNIVLKIEEHFKKLAGWSLLEEMNKDEASSKVSDTRIAQPAIMAIQIGLTELWKSWGIKADGYVGHSIGEVAAAYASGALSLEQAVEVIYHRSRGQNKATDKGKMLAVGLPHRDALKAIEPWKERVSVAAVNGPNMVALAGDTDALELIDEALQKKDVFTRYLKVNVPFHSHHMEPLKEELIQSLLHLQPKPAEYPLYSTVSGHREDGTHLVSEYWYQNVRETVLFSDAVQNMIEDGYNLFIEIAPHPILSVGVNELFALNKLPEAQIVPSLRRGSDELLTMQLSLGQLHTLGVPVQWEYFFGEKNNFVKTPAYPWQHQSYWFETEEHRTKRLGNTDFPFLLHNTQSAVDSYAEIWSIGLNKATHLFLDDHKVEGTIIFPGTGHLEVALEVGQKSLGEKFSHLENINLEAALFLPEEGEAPEVRLEITNDEGDYTICSRPKYSDEHTWTRHSTGRLVAHKTPPAPQPLSLDEVRSRATEQVSISDFYVELKEGGLNYGEAFRCVQKIWTGPKEVLSALSLPSSLHYEAPSFFFHPALLDACLHTLFASRKSTADEKRGIYLPVHIDAYHFFQRPGQNVWTHIEVLEASADYLRGNYTILNEDETIVAQIKGLTCKYIEGSRAEQKDDLYKGMYQYEWETDTNLSDKPHQLQNGESYLIFADNGQQYKSLERILKTRGAQTFIVKKGTSFQQGIPFELTVNPQAAEDLENVFYALRPLATTFSKIISFWALDATSSHNTDSTSMKETQEALTGHTLNLLKVVAQQSPEPALYLLNQGLEKITEHDRIDVSQAAINGLGRVLINEYPFIPLTLVNLSLAPENSEWETLCDLVGYAPKSHSPELALRGTSVYQRKLQPVLKEEAEKQYAQHIPALGQSFRPVITEHGLTDNLQFRNFRRRSPKATEVEIEVHAAGLNFKDVMNSMGLLSDEAVQGGVAGKQLGLECAGIVTAVGSEVTDFKPGDAVLAWAPESFSGFTFTEENCVVHKPSNISFEEGAAITVAFLTAHYSLNYLARLEADEKVLIHSATGGVGLAAIQLAKLRGAEIYATAGNDEKRAWLQSLGIKHIYDSRSLSFADEILKDTNGQGIDVVLNSLSGKAIAQNVKCLAPFGRFIEIGKADIYQDAKLALKRFGNNLSFYAVDLDRLMFQKPLLGKKLYTEIAEWLQQGIIQPQPIRSFPIQELQSALAQLSKGTHIGKLVVAMNEQPLEVLPATSLSLDPNASYLVTGGASGFGLELAHWLTQKGARHLILVSRSGTKTTYDQALIASMQKQGVQVVLHQLDITNFDEVQSLISKTQHELPPLKGIIHSAAVLRDATLNNMDQERFDSVYHPKVMGAWHFHLATQNLSLDFFLMLSSISSIFGLPGQSNYSSANNFLDKLAQYRQQEGQAACSVNLGVLGMYAGMSKEGEQVLKVLANQGWFPLSLKQVTEKIENILIQQPAYRMAANLDWKRFKDFFGHLQNDLRFADIIKAESGSKNGGLKGGASLAEQILELDTETRPAFLQEKIANSLAKILGTSTEQIDLHTAISKIGLDSLMLNQLRNWIQQKLEVNFPLMRIAKGPSIIELTEQLLDLIVEVNEVVEETDSDSSGIGILEDIEVVEKWLVRRKVSDQQSIHTRIFCIHPVGAGASMFSHFMYHAPANTEVLAFQLPGRENRKDEPFFESVPLLIEQMAQAMQPFLDKPFIIMGHSFGGILGYELIRYIKRNFGLSPAHLFISGTIAPQLTKKWKERDVISQTAVFTNSEERLLSLMSYIDDVEFLKKILPIMRKDMPLIMNYQYQETEQLDIPISAYAADKDEVVHAAEVARWEEQTNAGFELEVVPGDHWFLSRNKEQILAKLTEVAKAEYIS